jgi:hypothetical protein
MMSPFCASLKYIIIGVIFLHGNEYFEYLLGDLGYLDEEMLTKMLSKLTTKCMLGIE